MNAEVGNRKEWGRWEEECGSGNAECGMEKNGKMGGRKRNAEDGMEKNGEVGPVVVR